MRTRMSSELHGGIPQTAMWGSCHWFWRSHEGQDLLQALYLQVGACWCACCCCWVMVKYSACCAVQ